MVTSRQSVRVPNEATHAVLSTFNVDPTRRNDQEFGLRNIIVPAVREAPGFVSGIWTRTADGTKSTVVVAFSGEADARQFQASVRANASNQAAVGLTLVDSQLVEVSVIASA